MLSNNFLLLSGKMISETIWQILYFPAWWYTRGFLNVSKSMWNFLTDRQKSLALAVWIKNIFKPMYAQTDWQGRLISFFIRVVQIIFRGIAMIFWVIFSLAIIIVWVILPIFIIYEIVYQIT